MDSLVTVIIPVAEQHAGLLPRALRSLTNQTVQTHQIIVVNDTGKALRCDNGAKVLNTKGHQGASVARNLGIDRTETPFLMFLDADDMLFQSSIETLIRAYASYSGEANYLYGDALMVNGGREDYFVAPQYDRKLMFTLNLHNVTALLPTESVKTINGFDEEIKGWEDWEFYVRMGVNGFCGAKIPMPLIVYNIDTGVSRERHRQSQGVIIGDLHQRYADFISGKEAMMGCCGGGKAAKAAAEAFAKLLPPDAPVNGEVLMEYIGTQQGTVPFRVGDTTYRGANNNTNKFVKVRAEHVAQLERMRVWRKVPGSALQMQRPDVPLVKPPQIITARRVVAAPEAVSVPVGETKQELASGVTLIACARCGHLVNFHTTDRGCQALVNEAKCFCDKFALTEESKPDEPKDSGRPASRKRASKRNAGAPAKTV